MPLRRMHAAYATSASFNGELPAGAGALGACALFDGVLVAGALGAAAVRVLVVLDAFPFGVDAVLVAGAVAVLVCVAAVVVGAGAVLAVVVGALVATAGVVTVVVVGAEAPELPQPASAKPASSAAATARARSPIRASLISGADDRGSAARPRRP